MLARHQVHNIDGRAVEVSTLLQSKGFTVTIATTSDTKLTRNVLLAAVRP